VNTAAAIDRILSFGQMQTTYKLAVLRAVVDLVIERPAQEPRNGFHLVPIVELSRRVLAYYWKPALLGVNQGHQAAIIPRVVRELAERGAPGLGFDLGTESAGPRLAGWIEGSGQVPLPVAASLLDIRTVLLDQPLKALPNVPGRRLEVFHLLTLPAPGSPGLPVDADYEAHRRAASGRRAFRGADTWWKLLDRERTHLVVSARAYEEIAELRFWLRDAILMRWLQEMERFDAPATASTLALDLPSRDPALISGLKAFYQRIGWRQCVYTGQALGSDHHLDHVLPFSRFPVELFWNLVPSAPAANLEKSDRIPRLTSDVRDRYRQLIGLAVHSSDEHVLADLAWTYRKFLQQPSVPPTPLPDAAASVWSVVQGSWARLEAAGVSVWDPPRA